MERYLRFTRVLEFPGAKSPRRASQKAAGMDLFAAWTVETLPGDRELIPIGLTVDLPTGHFGRITDWSSVAPKKGLHVLMGTIDGDYTG
jgi:dUTP pyrophosphatase